MVDFFMIAARIASKLPPIVLLCFIITNYALFFPGYAYFHYSPFLTLLVSFFFSLTLLDYFICIFTTPGLIPSYFDFLPENSLIYISNAEFESNIAPAFVSFCEICQRNRPARAHHCSICEKCVLKRDHHCVWINNCVGLLNHKHFIQMLCYGCIDSCLIACACGSLVVDDYENSDYWSVFGCAFNFTTCMSLVFMGGYHLWLIFANRVMYEMKYAISENIFDNGTLANIRNQLGNNVWNYFLPLPYKVEEAFTDVKAVSVMGEIRTFRNVAILPEKSQN
jgi:palmitoyltransferase ZDHHC2/15/20